MRLTRIVLIATNVALLTAFWPLVNELQFTPASAHVTYRRSPVSPPVSSSKPEEPYLARPLFGIKPPLTEPDPSSSAASSMPNARLLGVVFSTERHVAMIELAGSTLRVEEGDDVNGWRVSKIEPRRIRLKNFEQQVDIFLDPPDEAH